MRLTHQPAIGHRQSEESAHCAVAGHSADCCCCFIVPLDVILKFSRDKKLSAAQRQQFANLAKFEREWRITREAQAKLSIAAHAILPRGAAPAIAAPATPVYDCKHGTTLPGTPVGNPSSSGDATVKRAYTETRAVAAFYRKCFGRNSVDGNGKTLLSSVHYSVDYNNAFWNGTQMTYGDGDGRLFVDFTRSNDVIAHELTHGVTQFTSGFGYADEPGGLNESMSDVFGSMFRQWRGKQTVAQADWLIGSAIMGPDAIARGYTCLRDMANPGAAHCLAPQPAHYSKYKPGMDPHYSSGIPNFAFYKAATAIGGKSWLKAGKVWYSALADFPAKPNMTMSQFAARTRSVAGSLFPNEPAVKSAIDSAWKAVGL
jgi:Zn-dependent metalloprotease